MGYIGKTPTVGNFQKCDALTTSGTADYTLQVSSVNVSPESVNHMIVSLNGVIQAPTTAYTVSGATLSFASALTSADVIDFVLLLGNVLDVGTPTDNTVATAKIQDDAVTLAKMAAGTDGNIISYDASGNPVAIATGTSGHFLKSQGAGSQPVFAAASSDYVKIASTTASGSAATLDVDNCFDDTTYNNYHITWDNISILTGGNSQIRFRLLDASGSVITGSDYRSINGWSYAASGSDGSGENRLWNSDRWYIHYDQIGQYDTNYQSFVGEMYMSQPQNTTWKCQAHWRTISESGGGTQIITNHGAGIYNASPIAHRGIRMYTVSGANFHSHGLMTVYGRK